MDTLTQFGAGAHAYSFNPARQLNYTDTFADLRTHITLLPGRAGGYDADGQNPAPARAGTVDYSGWLLGDDVAALRAAARGMAIQGRSTLFKRTHSGATQWTYARIRRIDTPQAAELLPHRRQKVRVLFDVPLPRWFSLPDALFLDSGVLLSDEPPLPGAQIDQQSVQPGDTLSLTNSGNAPAALFIRWQPNSNGDPIGNPTLTRLNEAGLPAEQVRYAATLSGADVLEIDCAQHSVTPDYAPLQVTSASWLTLPPGTHTLQADGVFVGSARLTLAWLHTHV